MEEKNIEEPQEEKTIEEHEQEPQEEVEEEEVTHEKDEEEPVEEEHEEEVTDENEKLVKFNKIMNDLLEDLNLTFPEYSDNIKKLKDNEDVKDLYNYCKK